jgi:Tfp pilus assembly protein FimT
VGGIILLRGTIKTWREAEGILKINIEDTHFVIYRREKMKNKSGTVLEPSRQMGPTTSRGSGCVVRKKIIDKMGPAGFTIMDLIVTMVILATLLGIAYPIIGQITAGYRLRGASREVATDLQFARLLAVKENKSYQVVCSSNSYQVVRVSDGFVAKGRSFSVDYPEVSLNAPAITFNSRGISSSSTVTVSNSAKTKNITVDSTGRVKLQ